MRRLGIGIATVAAVLLALPGTAFAQPTNDDFDSATTVTEPLPFNDSISTTDATPADDDPFCGAGGATVWYRYTPSSSGYYTASAAGSDYETTVAVYAGTRGALDLVACGSTITNWSAAAGTTYYLLVGSSFGTPGGQLMFTVQGPVSLDVTLDTRGQVDSRTGVAQVSGTLTCTATGSVGIRGELRQPVGRFTVSGAIFFFVAEENCDGTAHPWVATVSSDNGKFAGGRAVVSVTAEGCPTAELCVSDSATADIRLAGKTSAG